jgi:ribosomal protein S18 acetylase RimI-like enzyme
MSETESGATRIERLRSGEEARVVAVSHLFDSSATEAAGAKMLAQDNHYLLIAYEDEIAAGFVSGVEMTHPDKGTEMFLYELGVDPRFQGQGIGTALVRALAEEARDAGCYGMWVLTDDDNAAAQSAYANGGGTRDGTEHVMYTWDF